MLSLCIKCCTCILVEEGGKERIHSFHQILYGVHESKMIKELWHRAYILKGGNIFPQGGKNWFLADKKILPLLCIKYRYTYSTKTDIQYIPGIKNSWEWLERKCLKRLLREMIWGRGYKTLWSKRTSGFSSGLISVSKSRGQKEFVVFIAGSNIARPHLFLLPIITWLPPPPHISSVYLLQSYITVS